MSPSTPAGAPNSRPAGERRGSSGRAAPAGTQGVQPGDIACISQDRSQAVPQEYLAICTETADLLANSTYCEGTGRGGHPICRPCYDLARLTGLVK